MPTKIRNKDSTMPRTMNRKTRRIQNKTLHAGPKTEKLNYIPFNQVGIAKEECNAPSTKTYNQKVEFLRHKKNKTSSNIFLEISI